MWKKLFPNRKQELERAEDLENRAQELLELGNEQNSKLDMIIHEIRRIGQRLDDSPMNVTGADKNV